MSGRDSKGNPPPEAGDWGESTRMLISSAQEQISNVRAKSIEKEWARIEAERQSLQQQRTQLEALQQAMQQQRQQLEVWLGKALMTIQGLATELRNLGSTKGEPERGGAKTAVMSRSELDRLRQTTSAPSSKAPKPPKPPRR